jgi:hypothetical protein
MKAKFTSEKIIEAAEKASALEIALGGAPDKIPAGFRSRQEWQKIWKLKPTRTKQLLTEHTKSGRMEQKRFSVMFGPYHRQYSTFYKAIK